MTAANLDALLRPRSIALIGASPNIERHPGRSLANLLRSGYSGAIYPVNPRYTEVMGIPCLAIVQELPEGVDTAYVLLRADRVVPVLHELAERGVRSAVICTSGFAEEGAQGRELQEEMAEVARATGMRIVGPNCIGLVNVADRIVAAPTLNFTQELVPGPLSIVSQSGGMAVNAANRAQGRGLGVRHMVSVGNESDLTVADFVAALARDAHTEVIGLFVEQVRDVSAFLDAVDTAHQAGKRVVVLKVGSSAAAARSSLSHTGAMTGAHDVFTSVMQELGVLCVDSLDQLVDCAFLLSHGKAAGRGRLLVVSASGGECSYTADRAEHFGLTVPEMTDDTQRELKRLMRFGTPGNPLDLTGQVIGDQQLLQEVVRVIEKDDSFDAVLFAFATWGAHDAAALLPTVLDAAATSSKLAFVSAWDARNLTEEAERLLAEASVPTFTGADTALAALAALASAPQPRHTRPQTGLASLPRPLQFAGTTPPNEFSAKKFFTDQGVVAPREVLLEGHDDVRATVAEFGTPVVLKLLCRGVSHKSDLGLVRVGVTTPDEVESALNAFDMAVETHRLEAEGVLVSEMVSGVELIVGGVRDPDFGPMVMIGAGGVLTEVLSDRVLAQCPVDARTVTDLLGRLRIAPVLQGYRGSTLDLEALTDLIVRASEAFAASPWMAEFDLNPVMVSRDGAWAVDAAISLA
jgi:acyl-CoA synthetase (NDP forming)